MMVIKSQMWNFNAMKGRRFMPRALNYEKKLADIEAKIAKRTEEIKALREQMNNLKAQQSKNSYKELLDAIDAKGLTVEEVIGWVENHKAE